MRALSAPPPGPRIELHGLKGSYVKRGMDRQEDALKAGLRPQVDAPDAWGADPDDGELTVLEGDALVTRALATQRGAYAEYYRQIRDCLLGQGANPVRAEDALDVMRLLDAGLASARLRSEVSTAGA